MDTPDLMVALAKIAGEINDLFWLIFILWLFTSFKVVVKKEKD